MQFQKQNLTPLQAFQKAKHFCAYQERCHTEVQEKLYNYGLNSNEIAICISNLIEENYLNEERFAIAFAGGKFRIKQWGRVKIKYALQQKKISIYCINKGMEEIDDEKYIEVLKNLAIKKWTALKSEKNIFIKKRKLKDYLQQQGFELELISDIIKTL